MPRSGSGSGLGQMKPVRAIATSPGDSPPFHPPALAFRLKNAPKTCTSHRAQGVEYDKAGKAALFPRNRLALYGLSFFEKGRERRASQREPSRFDQILACDRKAAEHTKKGAFSSIFAPTKTDRRPRRAFGATSSNPAPAEGVLPPLPILHHRPPQAASSPASPHTQQGTSAPICQPPTKKAAHLRAAFQIYSLRESKPQRRTSNATVSI